LARQRRERIVGVQRKEPTAATGLVALPQPNVEEKVSTRLLITTAATLAALTPTLLTSALGEEPEDRGGLYSKTEKDLYVPSGKMRKLGSLYGAFGDCTPWDIKEIEVKTTQEPTNGTIQIVPGDVVAGFKKDSSLVKCSGRKMRALNVNYKSADKFVGTDEFELFIMWPNSRASEMHFIVNVK
jgi:hypothetical protein